MFKYHVWGWWTSTSLPCGSCAWSQWLTSWSWSTSPPTSSSTAPSPSSSSLFSPASVPPSPTILNNLLLKLVFIFTISSWNEIYRKINCFAFGLDLTVWNEWEIGFSFLEAKFRWQILRQRKVLCELNQPWNVFIIQSLVDANHTFWLFQIAVSQCYSSEHEQEHLKISPSRPFQISSCTLSLELRELSTSNTVFGK